jgi:hypothetical protein
MMHKDQTHMKRNCFPIGIISSKLQSGCYITKVRCLDLALHGRYVPDLLFSGYLFLGTCLLLFDYCVWYLLSLLNVVVPDLLFSVMNS